jgi:hypothetical protein
VSGQLIAELLDRVYATPQQLLDRVTAVSTENEDAPSCGA